MADRRILAVVGGGVALGAGFIALYLGVLAPRAETERVQAEVATYAAAWTALRGCLVGDAPRAQDGRAAIVGRFLIDGPFEAALAACNPLTRALDRPASSFAGDAVEAAWRDVLEAGNALIQDHARAAHASQARDNGDATPDLPLAAALGASVARLDGALAVLRAAGGLPAAPPPGPDLAALVATALPITGEVTLAFAGDTVAATARGDRAVRVVQRGPAAPETRSLGADVVAAADGGFGVWLDLGDEDTAATMRVGALDPQGEPAGAGVELASRPSGDLAPLFALAADPVRVAMWQQGSEVWLARSRDHGATWPERRAAATGRQQRSAPWLTQPAGDQLDLLTTGLGHEAWLSVRADTIAGPLVAEPILVPDDGARARPSGDWCVSGSSLHQLGPGVIQARAGEPTQRWPWPTPEDHGSIVACDARRTLALHRAGDEATYTAVLCGEPGGCAAARPVVLPERATSAATLTGPDLVLAIAADGVAVTWRGDPRRDPALTPTLHALPPDRALVGLLAWPDGPVAVLVGGPAPELLPLR